MDSYPFLVPRHLTWFVRCAPGMTPFVGLCYEFSNRRMNYWFTLRSFN